MSSPTVAFFFFPQKEMNAENVLIVWDCPRDSLIQPYLLRQALLKIGYVLNMMEFLKTTSSLLNLLLENEVPN